MVSFGDKGAEALMGYVKDAERERDELRAILQPLLDQPIRFVGEPASNECIFCEADSAWHDPHHRPSCPVLRRDQILGRTPA